MSQRRWKSKQNYKNSQRNILQLIRWIVNRLVTLKKAYLREAEFLRSKKQNQIVEQFQCKTLKIKVRWVPLPSSRQATLHQTGFCCENHCMGSGVLSVNTVHRAMHKCTLSLYYVKKTRIQALEVTLSPLSSLKMDWGKIENSSVIRLTEILKSFWKTWMRHPAN